MQACKWVWDDWDDRDSKGIWEIYASIYIFNAHLLIRLYVFAMLVTSPATISATVPCGHQWSVSNAVGVCQVAFMVVL